MRLVLLVSVAALAACSSTGEPAQSRVTQENSTTPDEPSPGGPTGEDPTPTDDDDEDGGTPPGNGGKDAGATGKDAGTVGPSPFTEAELQALVDDRCAPCHIDIASGGMSLANDFTTNTVEVASTQVPSMKRIAKGDHDKSYLWHKVNGTHASVGGTGARMPKGGTPLTATELARLAAYIDSLP